MTLKTWMTEINGISVMAGMTMKTGMTGMTAVID